MSFNQSYHHIIFSTKNREAAISEEREKDLYNYIWGILKKKRCHLYRIGGCADHIHIFTSVHSTVCIASVVRDIKSATTAWIQRENVFENFEGWQSEYASFSKADRDKDTVIEYIKDQKEHHKQESSVDELRRLLNESGIDFDDRYLQ